MNEPVQQTTIATEGWYADSTGTMRWWDGQSWTTHTAPQTPIASTATPAVPPWAGGVNDTAAAPQWTNSSRGAASTAVNPLAILSLICGFIPFVGAIALPLGRIALNQIRATGQRGRIPALIAITFGSLWLLDIFLVVLRMATKSQ